MKKMSTEIDTPRTDASLVSKWPTIWGEATGDRFVYADFARQLERELKEAHSQLAECYRANQRGL